MAYFLVLPEEPEPVPITHMFDSAGEDVATFEEAHTFVAGPLANGQWMSAPAEQYRLTVHH